MAVIKWSVNTSIISVFTTALDDLANGAEATSAAIDNTANLDMFGDFIFAAAYAVAPAANVKCAELYILPSADGTNYPSVASGGLPQKALFVGAFELPLSQTGLQYMALTGIPLPPLNLKFLISNTSGQAMASSATAKFLKMQPYRLQSV